VSIEAILRGIYGNKHLVRTERIPPALFYTPTPPSCATVRHRSMIRLTAHLAGCRRSFWM
jgi:hypothetical protein